MFTTRLDLLAESVRVTSSIVRVDGEAETLVSDDRLSSTVGPRVLAWVPACLYVMGPRVLACHWGGECTAYCCIKPKPSIRLITLTHVSQVRFSGSERGQSRTPETLRAIT
jgi:hypothetical protein